MVEGFKFVGIGGTFDHLHKGHELMLDTAFKLGETVRIGLNVRRILHKKEYLEHILSYRQRYANLLDFLNKRKYFNRYEIVPIDDIYGNFMGKGGVGTSKETEAIVVSAEPNVFENAFKVNGLRTKNGLNPVCIIGVPILEIDGKKISSTFIRGLIAKGANEKELLKYTGYPERRIITFKKDVSASVVDAIEDCTFSEEHYKKFKERQGFDKVKLEILVEKDIGERDSMMIWYAKKGNLIYLIRNFSVCGLMASSSEELTAAVVREIRPIPKEKYAELFKTIIDPWISKYNKRF